MTIDVLAQDPRRPDVVVKVEREPPPEHVFAIVSLPHLGHRLRHRRHGLRASVVVPVPSHQSQKCQVVFLVEFAGFLLQPRQNRLPFDELALCPIGSFGFAAESTGRHALKLLLRRCRIFVLVVGKIFAQRCPSTNQVLHHHRDLRKMLGHFFSVWMGIFAFSARLLSLVVDNFADGRLGLLVVFVHSLRRIDLGRVYPLARIGIFKN